MPIVLISFKNPNYLKDSFSSLLLLCLLCSFIEHSLLKYYTPRIGKLNCLDLHIYSIR